MTTRRATMAICAAVLCACAPMWMESDGLVSRANAQSECVREWLAGAPLPGVDRGASTATIVRAERSRSGREELYIGGYFNVAGAVIANGVAMWDGFEWRALGSGVANSVPFQSFDVREICALKNGDIVIAGRFTSAGGVPAQGIARWDGHAWHAMTTSPLSGVSSLVALPSGELLVCGSFAQIDGLTMNGVARWDGAQWHSVGGGVMQTGGAAASVEDARLCADGRVAVCGRFDVAGGVPISNVALLDVSAGTWEAPASMKPPVASASLVAPVPDGGLVVCGITNVGGAAARTSLQHWSTGTEAWVEVPLDPGLEKGPVFAINVDASGEILIGGYTIGRTTDKTYGIFRFDGTAWHHLGTNLFGAIDCVIQSTHEGILVVGGVRDGVRKLAGGEWRRLKETNILRPWVMREAADGTIYALGATGDYDIEYETGVFRYGAGWERVTGGFNGYPRTLTVLRSGDLVVAGDFTKVGDVDVPGVARFDGSAWHPVGDGLPGALRDLIETRDGRLVAATYPGWTNEEFRQSVYRLSQASWEPLGEPFRYSYYYGTGYASSLVEMPNGDIVAGGDFMYAGETAVTNVARWDGASWRAIGAGLGDTFNVNHPFVNALAVTSDGELFAGGFFYPFGSTTKCNLARVRPGASEWEPVPGIEIGGYSPIVRAISLTAANDLLAIGWFGDVSGQSMNGVLRWRRSTNTPEPLGQGVVSGALYQLLALRNGDIVAAGDQLAMGDRVSDGFAIWGCRCVADADADGMITFEDFDAFVAAFERGDASADLNADGFITMEDFDAFVGVFETGC
ncbi:MAG: GC-type dockerin domain-anchored protein [Planctomycetota bacterium]|nr:GC-type dockerin domain-anchored protein [Planctomycetota bacterium]